MPRLWLPLGRSPTRPVRNEREAILRRLAELGVVIAGSSTMETAYLRDWLQREEDLAAKPREDRPLPTVGLTKAQIIQELRDYCDHLRARREGRRRVY